MGHPLKPNGKDGSNKGFVLAVGNDGRPIFLGDRVVWDNGEDEPEEFVVRGFVTEGGVDGDVFLIDADHNECWLGCCRKLG